MTNAYRADDEWLETYIEILGPPTPDTKILELGCGEGRDTRFLSERGFAVTATDISQEQLELCKQNAPRAVHRVLDLRAPLPFADNSFSVVLASLCLHYFDWDTTKKMVADIHRILKLTGHLIVRVNSTSDVNYGAVGFAAIAPNFYSVLGKEKRFFSDSTLTELFATSWTLTHLEEREIDRYDKPKRVWQLVAKPLEPS